MWRSPFLTNKSDVETRYHTPCVTGTRKSITPAQEARLPCLPVVAREHSFGWSAGMKDGFLSTCLSASPKGRQALAVLLLWARTGRGVSLLATKQDSTPKQASHSMADG